ncbi:MAG: ATP-grasp domain-containing protein [Flavobacteriales bacterium]|jgi:biotin carboxylase|nr:ATP-grasp domain-containing protein [Flavobacteriales bacterium]
MKKVLIIGAGVEQVSAIKKGRELGLYVIATDMNPDAPGVKYADQFYKVSTTDSERNIKIGLEEKINGVFTVCSETAVTTVAEVAKALNLKSFSLDTARKATNKHEMRKAFQRYNINVSPNMITKDFSKAEEFWEENTPPFVIKPVDSSGQRGTFVLKNKEEFEEKFSRSKAASYSGEVLIDKKIEGREVHVTMQVIKGEVFFLAITDRVTLDNENFGIAVRHIGPSILKKEVEEEIKKECEKAVKSIDLKDGVATCEIIIDKNDELFFMEIAVRVPGGYLREVAMLLSGVDVVEATILNAIQDIESLEAITNHKKYDYISAKFITAKNLPEEVNRITKIELNYQNDQLKLFNKHFDGEFVVEDLKSSVGRFAVIIAVGRTRNEAVDISEEAFKSILINGVHSLKAYDNYNKFNANFKTD